MEAARRRSRAGFKGSVTSVEVVHMLIKDAICNLHFLSFPCLSNIVALYIHTSYLTLCIVDSITITNLFYRLLFLY